MGARRRTVPLRRLVTRRFLFMGSTKDSNLHQMKDAESTLMTAVRQEQPRGLFLQSNSGLRFGKGLAQNNGHGFGQTASSSRQGEMDAFKKIEESIAYMMSHLDQPLQVATLTAIANISPSHFFALFKRLTGFAPIDFFIRLRMSQACKLLDTTSLSVKEVAAKLGYNDPFYFSRIFKSVNRVAPSEYRTLSKKSRAAIRNTVWPGSLIVPVNNGAARRVTVSGKVGRPARRNFKPARLMFSAVEFFKGNFGDGRILNGKHGVLNHSAAQMCYSK